MSIYLLQKLMKELKDEFNFNINNRYVDYQINSMIEEIYLESIVDSDSNFIIPDKIYALINNIKSCIVDKEYIINPPSSIYTIKTQDKLINLKPVKIISMILNKLINTERDEQLQHYLALP